MYVFVNSNLTKTEYGTKKNINTAFTLLLWVKVLFLPKKGDFLQKNADISKIRKVLVLKGIFPETTYVCTYVPNLKFLA